jgi:hypothetical protein
MQVARSDAATTVVREMPTAGGMRSRLATRADGSRGRRGVWPGEKWRYTPEGRGLTRTDRCVRRVAAPAAQAFSATSTSSSIFFASPNSIRLFSL